MEMRITRAPQINDIYKPNANSKQQRLSRAEEKDSVTISEHGKDFQSVLKAIKDSPEVREDKVNRIKSQIENGTYNVSAEEIANKMVNNYIMMRSK